MNYIIKMLLPPIFIKLYRKIIPIPPAADGDYAGRFNDPPSIPKDPFSSKGWLKHIESCLLSLEKKNYHQTLFNNHDLLLSLLVSIKKGAVVLDFGGGAGLSYFWAKSQQSDFKFIVVDLPASLTVGKNFFKYPNIAFQESIPDKADIINVNGVLHYIQDWKSVLTKLLKLKPEYFLLCRHLSVEGLHKQTYTVQNVYPHGLYTAVLIPENELISEFQNHGYALIGNWAEQDLNYRFSSNEYPEKIFERTLLFKNK